MFLGLLTLIILPIFPIPIENNPHLIEISINRDFSQLEMLYFTGINDFTTLKANYVQIYALVIELVDFLLMCDFYLYQQKRLLFSVQVNRLIPIVFLF